MELSSGLGPCEIPKTSTSTETPYVFDYLVCGVSANIAEQFGNGKCLE